MSMRTLTSTRVVPLLGLLLGLFATPAAAELIDIHFTGLDLVYDGTNIYDATSIAGGSGRPEDADPLASVLFYVDRELVGTLSEDIFADVLIRNVPHMSAEGGTVVASGHNRDFGFDLLTSLDGGGIAINVDDFEVYYRGNEIAIAASAVATGLRGQDLPFGLAIDEDDTIAVIVSSANLSEFTYNEDRTLATGFHALGTGDLRGTLAGEPATIPEPSTLVLAVCGLLGLLAFVRLRGRR